MTEPVLRVLSLGAGVQSTTLALMASCGEIEPPDMAVFADTGWEPQAVYDHLERLVPQLTFPYVRATAAGPSLKDRLLALEHEEEARRLSFAAVPFFTSGGGMGRRQCTKEYKLAPIRDAIKARLGIEGRVRLPKDSIECWIGISTDEAHRMKEPPEGYLRNRWPLIELNMTRIDCIAWLQRHGHGIPPKSSCLGCPYHSDRNWADIRDQSPDEWDETVKIDRLLRLRALPDVEPQFMHQSRVPLEDAPLLPTSREGQMDLFGNECEGMCGV